MAIFLIAGYDREKDKNTNELNIKMMLSNITYKYIHHYKQTSFGLMNDEERLDRDLNHIFVTFSVSPERIDDHRTSRHRNGRPGFGQR